MCTARKVGARAPSFYLEGSYMFRNRLVDGCQPSEAHGVNHRTLEVRCGNCDARFVAWYRTEEDPGNEVKDVEKCRLWGGDPLQVRQLQGRDAAADSLRHRAERQAGLVVLEPVPERECDCTHRANE